MSTDNDLTPEEIAASIELFKKVIAGYEFVEKFIAPLPHNFLAIKITLEELVERGQFTSSELKDAIKAMNDLTDG